MASGPSRTLVRGLYRKMLLLSRGIPDASKRESAINSIRSGFRANAAETDGQVVEDLLAEAQKHVSFMKIVGRRRPGGGGQGAGGSKQKGKTTYVRDRKTGKWVSGTSAGPKATTVGGGHWGQVTSEHVRRAAALNRRQHFGDRG